MIIDSTVVPSLALTTDRAIPNVKDSEVQIPNLLLLGMEPIQPLSVLSVTNVALRDSFVTEAQINKNNPNPAGTQDLAIVAKGLWTIQMNMLSFTLGTAGTWRNNFLAVVLAYQGFSIPLLRVLHVGTTGVHTAQQGQWRFLLREDATLQLTWLAPAAGEYIGCNLNVQATRHV